MVTKNIHKEYTRSVRSSKVSHSHRWLLKLNTDQQKLEQLKYSRSVSRAMFQVPSRHMWLMTTVMAEKHFHHHRY